MILSFLMYKNGQKYHMLYNKKLINHEDIQTDDIIYIMIFYF